MTPKLIREQLLVLLNKHRTHVQNSPGVGVDLQRYAIAVIDDIDMELRTLAAEPVGGEDHGMARKLRRAAENILDKAPSDLTELLSEAATCIEIQFSVTNGMRQAIKDLQAESAAKPDSAEGDFRKCVHCGCNTNAKLRACCEEGRAEDKLRATDEGKDAPIDLAGLERHRAHKAEQPKAEGGFTRCDCDCPNGLKHIDIMHDDTCAALSAAPQPEVHSADAESLARDGAQEILASLPPDDFNGDNKKLIASIEALISLDTKGALVPHGVGGHAKALLASAARRLAQPPQQADGGAVAPTGWLHEIEWADGWGAPGYVHGAEKPSPFLEQCPERTRHITARTVKGERLTPLYAAHPPKSPGVGVDDAMVTRALDAQPFADVNITTRVWQTIGHPDTPKIMRAALQAALGGEK